MQKFFASIFIPNFIIPDKISNREEHFLKKKFFEFRKLAINLKSITPLISLDADLVFAFENQTLSKLANTNWIIILSFHNFDCKYLSKLLLAEEIKKQLVGFTIKIAFAPTVTSASALACFSGDSLQIVSPAELKCKLADYPIQALRVNHETESILQNHGIYSIAELNKFPTSALLQYFGYELIKKRDQLFGYLAEELNYLS